MALLGTKIKIGILLIVGSIFFTTCTEKETPKSKQKEIVVDKPIDVPDFNQDSAYFFIEKQVNFGPRVPNTKPHRACANYLINKLQQYMDTVIVQETKLKAFDLTMLEAKNIIGVFNPQTSNRVLLCAHWDTRPFADQCTIEDRKNDPIDGANDGASGVGVLLEVARQIQLKNPSIGIDIIFFDAEDYGQPQSSNIPQQGNTWCLGSQYWARNPHTPNYYAKYGILLDMVGAVNATFAMEGTSMHYASNIVKKVWDYANRIGYGNYFIYEKSDPITDDHLYINQLANIPCIDIIQYDKTSATYFGSYWHTHDDNLDVIDKNTLKAVGQTVLETIYHEK